MSILGGVLARLGYVSAKSAAAAPSEQIPQWLQATGAAERYTLPPATDASLANSTETSGIRVDGRDTLTQPITNLSAASGTIKWKWTPRHSAANVLKFGEYASEDDVLRAAAGSDYIYVGWLAANTLTFRMVLNAVLVAGTWNATGAIVAGTTYTMQIDYTGGGNATLSVDGVVRITLNNLGSAFTAVPTTMYWGSYNDGTAQSDGTFAAAP